jgi:hypothetical protein
MPLTNAFAPSGNLSKVHIEAYSDESYDQMAGTFDVLYNPATYDLEYKNEFDTDRPENATDSLPLFKSAKGKELQLELLWDATGASFTGNESEFTLIRGEGHIENSIQRFLQLTFELQSSTHRPNFLKISWGTLLFQGVLVSAKVSYSLFASDGKPLRAKVACSFMSHKALEEQAAEAQRNSPDLTHYRVSNGTDSLGYETFLIYGNPRFLYEVARVNKINNIRRRETARRIAFPPISKT